MLLAYSRRTRAPAHPLASFASRIEWIADIALREQTVQVRDERTVLATRHWNAFYFSFIRTLNRSLCLKVFVLVNNKASECVCVCVDAAGDVL